MKIVIDVDINNPIHHAEGTDYLMPDIHEFISENMLKILKEKGKVLPKGHGKLIDADAIIKELSEMNVVDEKDKQSVRFATIVLENAPTIIEADKAESEKEK